MRLFAPNIEKLVEKGDTEGLLAAVRWGLKHGDLERAKQALFGLSDVHDRRAVQPLIEIALGFGSVPYEAAVLPLFSAMTASGGAAALRPMLEAWSDFCGWNGRYGFSVLKGHEAPDWEMDVRLALAGFSEAEILEAVHGTPNCTEYKRRRARGEATGGARLQPPADLAVADVLGLMGGAEALKFLEEDRQHIPYPWNSREAGVYALAIDRIKERLATKKGKGARGAKG